MTALAAAVVSPSVTVLPSPIVGVSDEEWTTYVLRAATSLPGAISSTNTLGMFEMKPRRLVDLGFAKEVFGGRTGAFAAVFEPPLTREVFLADKEVQYQAFTKSNVDYVERLRDGSIPRPTVDGMTLSGALIILHRCGPQGLQTWATQRRFSLTETVYERCNAIF